VSEQRQGLNTAQAFPDYVYEMWKLWLESKRPAPPPTKGKG
jgi:hypothetical protein